MKTLYSLTQQFEQWRRVYQPKVRLFPSKLFDSSAVANGSSCKKQPTEATREGVKQGLGSSMRRYHLSRLPLLWVVGVVALTSATGYRFYNQPKLAVGTEAPETIRAPFDARVEDATTTEEKRKAARTQFVLVLMFNQGVTQQIYQELEQSLVQAEKLRSQAGSFPYLQTSILSNSSQIFLRQTEEWEWRAVLAAVDSNQGLNSASSAFALPKTANEQLNPAFAKAVDELEAYRRLKSEQAFTKLIEAIARTRQQYTGVIEKLPSQPEEQRSLYHPSLLDLSDDAWQQTQIGIRQAASRMLTQGIPSGLPPNILQQAVKMQVSSLVPAEAEPLATQLLLGILRPNLTEDQAQMEQRAEEAAQAVKSEIISVRRQEVIVSAGEKITQSDFVLLDYFGLSKRGINWLGLISFGGIVTGAVGVFLLVERRVYPTKTGQGLPLRRRDHLLVLLLTLSTPLFGTFGANYINLPAVGWLVGSFYGPALGFTVVGLLTGLVSSSIVGWDYLLGGAAAGVVGALLTGRMRSREELALLGGGVGLTQGIVYLVVRVIISATTGSIASTVLLDATLYGLAGLAWSVVALGISPYLEHLFDLVTPIRLVELTNPNRPLLKRLAAETPGTFQHTLFVANLAEAAARELGCNVELVRAGTLYHDIGKMHDPMGFIENQMGAPNKHDEIGDPWESAQIIKKHVSQGVAMARKHRLPKAIQAFIPEHQGTILIAYFYHQAQQIAQQDPTKVVHDEDFRYDGPIPQSRETGIVMLADACEAALRSLKDATVEDALSMINKILRARWQDNQLIDSGLTREDLSVMAAVFVQVWQQSNHQRIAYPKLALTRLRSAIKSQQSGTIEPAKE